MCLSLSLDSLDLSVVIFPCWVTALSLEKTTSFILGSVLTLTSDFSPILCGIRMNLQLCQLPRTHSVSGPQAVGGSCGH